MNTNQVETIKSTLKKSLETIKDVISESQGTETKLSEQEILDLQSWLYNELSELEEALLAGQAEQQKLYAYPLHWNPDEMSPTKLVIQDNLINSRERLDEFVIRAADIGDGGKGWPIGLDRTQPIGKLIVAHREGNLLKIYFDFKKR